MAETLKKSFDSPEETRKVDKGTVEILDMGGTQVMRATFEPGWKWSESVKPVAGTDTCQVGHRFCVLVGSRAVFSSIRARPRPRRTCYYCCAASDAPPPVSVMSCFWPAKAMPVSDCVSPCEAIRNSRRVPGD